jgi:hypothetical protein
LPAASLSLARRKGSARCPTGEGSNPRPIVFESHESRRQQEALEWPTRMNEALTWRRIRIVTPGSRLHPVAGPPLVDFTDAEHGWLIIGTSSWRTADGGRTWHHA